MVSVETGNLDEKETENERIHPSEIVEEMIAAPSCSLKLKEVMQEKFHPIAMSKFQSSRNEMNCRQHTLGYLRRNWHTEQYQCTVRIV